MASGTKQERVAPPTSPIKPHFPRLEQPLIQPLRPLRETLGCALKGLYRTIEKLEAAMKLPMEPVVLPRRELEVTRDVEGSPSTGSCHETLECFLERERWQTRIDLHWHHANAIRQILRHVMNPRMGSQLCFIALKYRLTNRLWGLSFDANLEALRQASLSSPIAFQLLERSLTHAHDFYAGLLRNKNLSPFKVAWLEALGDLSRYRIVVLTMRTVAFERAPNSTEPRQLAEEATLWREWAEHWYLAGLEEEPGNGRLLHHVGLLLRDIKAEALRSLFYFAKSMVALHPSHETVRSILLIWSPCAQDYRRHGMLCKQARPMDAFIFLHGMLFHGQSLGEFDTVLADLVECLEADTVREEEWAMMAAINIASILNYGRGGCSSVYEKLAVSHVSFSCSVQLTCAMLRLVVHGHVHQPATNHNPYIGITLAFISSVAERPSASQPFGCGILWREFKRLTPASVDLSSPVTDQGPITLLEDHYVRGMRWVEACGVGAGPSSDELLSIPASDWAPVRKALSSWDCRTTVTESSECGVPTDYRTAIAQLTVLRTLESSVDAGLFRSTHAVYPIISIIQRFRQSFANYQCRGSQNTVNLRVDLTAYHGGRLGGADHLHRRQVLVVFRILCRKKVSSNCPEPRTKHDDEDSSVERRPLQLSAAIPPALCRRLITAARDIPSPSVNFLASGTTSETLYVWWAPAGRNIVKIVVTDAAVKNALYLFGAWTYARYCKAKVLLSETVYTKLAMLALPYASLFLAIQPHELTASLSLLATLQTIFVSLAYWSLLRSGSGVGSIQSLSSLAPASYITCHLTTCIAQVYACSRTWPRRCFISSTSHKRLMASNAVTKMSGRTWLIRFIFLCAQVCGILAFGAGVWYTIQIIHSKRYDFIYDESNPLMELAVAIHAGSIFASESTTAISLSFLTKKVRREMEDTTLKVYMNNLVMVIAVRSSVICAFAAVVGLLCFGAQKATYIYATLFYASSLVYVVSVIAALNHRQDYRRRMDQSFEDLSVALGTTSGNCNHGSPALRAGQSQPAYSRQMSEFLDTIDPFIRDVEVQEVWNATCICGRAFPKPGSYTSHIAGCSTYLRKLTQEQSDAKPGWELRKRDRVKGPAAIRSMLGMDLDFDMPSPQPQPSKAAALPLHHDSTAWVLMNLDEMQAYSNEEETIRAAALTTAECSGPVSQPLNHNNDILGEASTFPEEGGRGMRQKKTSTRLKDFVPNGKVPLGLSRLATSSSEQRPVAAANGDTTSEITTDPTSEVTLTYLEQIPGPRVLPIRETTKDRFGLYKRYQTEEQIPHDPDAYISLVDLQDDPAEELFKALQREEYSAQNEGQGVQTGEHSILNMERSANDTGQGVEEAEQGQHRERGAQIVERSRFHPYPNESCFKLGQWFWEDASEKSANSFQKLVSIIGSDTFRPEDVRQANWTAINKDLGASEFDETDPTKSHWYNDGTSWTTAPVTIDVPFSWVSNSPGPKPYTIEEFRYRPLVPLIRKKLESSDGLQHFHHIPHELRWQPGPDKEDVRVYCELYHSDAFLEAYEEIQSLPPEGPNDDLPRCVVGLMFGSDATMLAHFGTAKLWPLYMFFANDTKYKRNKTSLQLGEQVAYFEKLPDDFKDWWLETSGQPNIQTVLQSHCQRELIHGQLRVIFDDEFMHAYEHGIVVKCADGIERRFYPRILTYSADYPEKILLAGIRNLGTCLCTRCSIQKKHAHRLGMVSDRKNRVRLARVDDDYRKGLIDKARAWIYERNISVGNETVNGFLQPLSLVANTNAFSDRFSPYGFNLFDMLTSDVMHEVELGVWKSLFIQLLRLLDVSPSHPAHILDSRFRQVPTFGKDTIRRFRNNTSEMKQLAARDYEDMLQCAVPVFKGLLEDNGHNKRVLSLLFILAHWHGLAKLRTHTDHTLQILDDRTTDLGAAFRTFLKDVCLKVETQELKREAEARKRRNVKKTQKAKPNPPPPENAAELAPAKKATTKKAPTKRAPAKKALSKKPPTKKGTAKGEPTSKGLAEGASSTSYEQEGAPLERDAGRSGTTGAAITREEASIQAAALEQDQLPPPQKRRKLDTTDGSRRPKTFTLHTFKFHALGHVVTNIKRFGCSDNYSTQMPESYHRGPKAQYKRTSKRRVTLTLSRIQTRQARIRRLRQQILSQEAEGPVDLTVVNSAPFIVLLVVPFRAATLPLFPHNALPCTAALIVLSILSSPQTANRTTESTSRPPTPPSPAPDCDKLCHTWDSAALLDYHLTEPVEGEAGDWSECEYQPCPSRYKRPHTDSGDPDTRLPRTEDEHGEKAAGITVRLRTERREARSQLNTKNYLAAKEKRASTTVEGRAQLRQQEEKKLAEEEPPIRRVPPPGTPAVEPLGNRPIKDLPSRTVSRAASRAPTRPGTPLTVTAPLLDLPPIVTQPEVAPAPVPSPIATQSAQPQTATAFSLPSPAQTRPSSPQNSTLPSLPPSPIIEESESSQKAESARSPSPIVIDSSPEPSTEELSSVDMAELAGLLAKMDTLITTMTTQKNAATTNKSAVQRPAPFKSGTNDARRYLQYFTLWARVQGPPMNEGTTPDAKHWISAFLSGLEGEAATWASQHLEKITNYYGLGDNRKDADFPCGGDWNTFVGAFKTRFFAADDALAAQRELETISQGSRSVADYAARFQEVSGRTGLSDTDLIVRFNKGLAQKPKEWLTIANLGKDKPKVLADLIKSAIDVDFAMRGISKEGGKAATAAADPYAMEIDANRTGGNGRTRDDFTRQMRGKCYGCGSSSHVKRDGNHGSTKCDYCGRLGHFARVCQDRFMGLSKGRGNRTGQRVAATSEFSLFPEDTPTAPAASTSAAAANDIDMATIRAMVERQEKLFSLLAAKAEVPYSVSAYDSISSCTLASTREIDSSSSHFRVRVKLRGRNRSTDTAAMVDCGATALFLDHNFVSRHRITTFPLRHSIDLFNIDGSPNTAGQITHFARLCLTVDQHEEWTDFLVTDLGGEDVILGLPWLRRVNPSIDWAKGWIRTPPKSSSVQVEEIPEQPFSSIGATTGINGTLLDNTSPEPPALPDPSPIPVLDMPPGLPTYEEGCDFGRKRPDPDPAQVPLPDDSDDDPPPLVRIRGNRRTRRAWLRAGRIEHLTDDLWCAAGYTFSQQIAEEAFKSKPVKTFEEMVPPWYRQHAHVFSEKESERLPEHQLWDHAIDFLPDAPPTLRTKVYPMSPNEQQELIRFLEENLQKGYIRPSKSPLASPVFFVKKKDGKLRFVQDYRKLNEITVKNRYPLPLVSDIINRLQGAKYFSKFDVRWGYNNVAVYLDDILIFTATLEEHREIVNEVLTRLRKHDLYLRPEKCEFEKTEIEYLGLVIREGEIRMDPAKVEAVRNWPIPKNLREVRGFLGFANFYRRFIKDFSKIARPLNDLTKKDTPWTWGPDQQAAFETLRTAFISSPILAIWDPNRPTRIEVDASGYATGGVFLQKLDDGLWHPVAFRSASMQQAERNYEIYDREMLAIIEALKDWRHFLEGLPEAFEIVTDHSNLEYWRTAQDLSRRQCRWSLYLSRFNFFLTHRPGKANTQADPLSRMPHHRISDADDNRQQTVLRPEHFAKLAATSMTKIAATTLLRNPPSDRIRQQGTREAEVLKRPRRA
ncbi:hypothetical protein NMY22_g7130 [Coprinellus aureogranulatus]|nr:hypothetical protein NMY22_g7130 [Coprinellus aureogranulatus]